MSIFKIALRSLQHRGIGSTLTILSMALGVMLVVAVLTIYGVVERSFKANTSFGYDVVVGARGGNTQLMLNTVFYLSRPVENIPYEYYLAFCDRERRSRELKHSIAYNSHITRHQLQNVASELTAIMPLGGPLGWINDMASDAVENMETRGMTLDREGHMYQFTDVAVPLALGDYFDEKFRVVGTTPEFFTDIVLDVDTKRKFEFAEGRAFEEFNEQNGFFECVLGATVARESGTKIGDLVYPIHGDPALESSHIHEQGFVVVGILKPTGSANDRVCFTNLEGHFLMEDHAKPIEETSIFGSQPMPSDSLISGLDVFDVESNLHTVAFSSNHVPEFENRFEQQEGRPLTMVGSELRSTELRSTELPGTELPGSNPASQGLVRTRLPIEQREVTAILIRSYTGQDEMLDDDLGDLLDGDVDEDQVIFMDLGMGQAIATSVNDGQLESALGWSFFRPDRAQKVAQAISPVYEVTSLFENMISPIRWLLLLLTVMICVVSGISILVGIYNSMTQRRHELAVIRALGAGRTTVMSIMLMESILLSLTGGMIGWIGGHALNAVVSPFVERNTGVAMGFFSFAPGPELGTILGRAGDFLPQALQSTEFSIELLLIPGLICLAIIVGIYPAITAYRTDVANSLSK